MKSGTLNNDGKHSMIYRGIEDIFGNIWQYVDGINVKDYQAFVNYNPESYVSDTFSGDYKPVGYINSKDGGYILKLGYDAKNPLISFATSVGGDRLSYIPDFYGGYLGNRIALIGGSYLKEQECGFWYWHMQNYSSQAYTSIGARLLRYA